MIADWLVLIPVLALELGAALAVVLIEAVAAGSKAEVVTAEVVPSTVSTPETVSTALLPAPCSGDDQLLEALTRAGRPLRNDELARAMRVSPGEASKRRKAVEHLVDVERRLMRYSPQGWSQDRREDYLLTLQDPKSTVIAQVSALCM